ncbi:hypothetical protein [Pseudoalteromonas luteoviolacea]|uniref:hypothetical protein n=1 Tax=Pseudoalteromonas luteoviolacea TaxID=43657 RepID=UPI001B35DA3A|nr:hypothetical protein [Pseudoalteromonas luteoviolacea]MBQ4834790.1 hypothetical protein [Pseudoalteromonas luteoviolacea]
MKYSTILLASAFFMVGCKSTTEEPVTDNSIDSQQEITLEEFCKTNPCRQNKHVKFNTDNGAVDQVLPLYWPAAQGNKISILPGDELFIEAEILDGERIGNFKQVPKIVNPKKTIKFSFTQMDSSVGMMLSVKNPFPFHIKYHLNMIDFSGQPHQTSSCPVRANISVSESWPHPIPELILTEMHKQEDGESMACVY